MSKKGDRCFWCGKYEKHITRDHVIPVSFGGGNYGNIVWACHPCNNERGRVSHAIKNGFLDDHRELYERWLEIEKRQLGHSPTESLLSMVSSVTPRGFKQIRSESKNRVQASVTKAMNRMVMRKCCQSFAGKDSPHSADCKQSKKKQRKCCATDRCSDHHLPTCTHVPQPPKFNPHQRRLSDKWRQMLQWQDDGGANTH